MKDKLELSCSYILDHMNSAISIVNNHTFQG